MSDAALHKARLRAYFDGVGFDRWNAIYGESAVSRIRQSVRAGHAQMLHLVEAWIRELRLPPGATALDAGCGTGLLSVAMARGGLRVLAVDIAPRMVDATMRRAVAESVDERIACGVRDIEHVEGSYDLVACLDVLMHYPRADFAQMCDALARRTHGTLLVSYAPRTPVLAALHWIGGCFPRAERRTAIHMQPDNVVRATLEATGMSIRRTRRIDHGFYHVTVLEAAKHR